MRRVRGAAKRAEGPRAAWLAARKAVGPRAAGLEGGGSAVGLP